MMLPTTVRTFLVAALFSLPLSMPLHADEDGSPSALSIEPGLPEQESQEKIFFTSDRVDNDEAGVEKTETTATKEDGKGSVEGTHKEPTSPSDDGSGERTPPAEKEDNKLNPGDKPDAKNPGKHDPVQDNPPKPDQKDEINPNGLYDFENVAYFLKHCPTLLQKLYESVWFQVQTVGALTVIPFMTYKTLVHLKKLFTDKEMRGKHAVHSLLYATSGIITLKAFIQYVLELNAQAAQRKA